MRDEGLKMSEEKRAINLSLRALVFTHLVPSPCQFAQNSFPTAVFLRAN